MIRIEKLLMIGATARNSGKTELVSMVIRKFSDTNKIIGIKISTYLGNDEQLHGQNQIHLKENFIIDRETGISSGKNTSKMLAAGAMEAYWIQSKTEYLETAIREFLPQLDKSAYIVCESNSLGKVVKPDVLIMISNNNFPVKSSAMYVVDMADLIIELNGKELPYFDISNITIINNKWNYRRSNFQ